MDRNGRLIEPVAPLANYRDEGGNASHATADGTALGIDKHAELPKFHTKTFVMADAQRSDSRQRGRRPLMRREEGRDLRHLLRELQQAEDGPRRARRAQSYRRGNESRLSRLLRHAVSRAGGTRARGGECGEGFEGIRGTCRRRLRHHHAHGFLRPDAQIRVAADRARERRREMPGAARPTTSTNMS